MARPTVVELLSFFVNFANIATIAITAMKQHKFALVNLNFMEFDS